MIDLKNIDLEWKFIQIENTKDIKNSIIWYEVDAPEQSELDIFFDILDDEVENADIWDDTTLYYGEKDDIYTVYYKKSNWKYKKIWTIDSKSILS